MKNISSPSALLIREDPLLEGLSRVEMNWVTCFIHLPLGFVWGEALTAGISWPRKGRMSMLSLHLLGFAYVSTVFLWSLPTILLGWSIKWDQPLGEGSEFCSGNVARNSWENEHRELLTHCLSTSVAKDSRMLLDKHHLCGHTLFHELSHQPGWLLKCCLIIQAAENKERRYEM